jgi:hypothetical protein
MILLRALSPRDPDGASVELEPRIRSRTSSRVMTKQPGTAASASRSTRPRRVRSATIYRTTTSIASLGSPRPATCSRRTLRIAKTASDLTSAAARPEFGHHSVAHADPFADAADFDRPALTRGSITRSEPRSFPKSYPRRAAGERKCSPAGSSANRQAFHHVRKRLPSRPQQPDERLSWPIMPTRGGTLGTRSRALT